MTHIEELGKLFDEFSDLFEQLSDLQQEKIQAAQQDDLHALDHCMQREQAISLKLRGMQRQREKVHQELGLEHISLRELPEHLPAAERAQIAPAITRFKTTYELYSSSAAASRAILETILQEINHMLEETKAPDTKPARKQGNFTDIKA